MMKPVTRRLVKDLEENSIPDSIVGAFYSKVETLAHGVLSQTLGAEKTDHLIEPRIEEASPSHDQSSLAMLPQNMEMIPHGDPNASDRAHVSQIKVFAREIKDSAVELSNVDYKAETRDDPKKNQDAKLSYTGNLKVRLIDLIDHINDSRKNVPESETFRNARELVEQFIDDIGLNLGSQDWRKS